MERLFYKHKFGYIFFKIKLNSFKKKFNLQDMSKNYIGNDDFAAKIEGSIIIILIRKKEKYREIKRSLDEYFY